MEYDQSYDEEDNKSRKQVFKYEYFLNTKEFQQLADRLNHITTENRLLYLQTEFNKLQRIETRNKTVCSIEVIVFIHVLYDQLCQLVKTYQSMLGVAPSEAIEKMEGQLYSLTQIMHTLQNYEDFKLPVVSDNGIQEKILDKLDELFLYTNNIELLLPVAGCFSQQKVLKYHFAALDLSLPNEYFFAKIESIYKKYEKYFSCTELPSQSLTMKKQNSSKDQRLPIGLKKTSSKQQKNAELSPLTLPDLLNLKSMRKICMHLEKDYMTPEDKITLLLSLKCLVLKNQLSFSEDYRTQFYMLDYSFMRIDFLGQGELSLPKERQTYEDLLIRALSHVRTDEKALRMFLISEPKWFLQRPDGYKRNEVGEIEKFVCEQLELIELAFKDGNIPKNLVSNLLKREYLLDFIRLVSDFVYSFDQIFKSTTQVEIYKYYMRMLEFLKRCYLSFAAPLWFYPLQIFTLVDEKTFSEFHVDIEPEIKDNAKKMIKRFNEGDMPCWVTFDNGAFRTEAITKLQFFHAIKSYLTDCGKLQNNFLQFDEIIPTDVQSSMLIIELVRIRFHSMVPNEEQKKFYKLALEECMVHNVNPRFRWFEGFDFKVDVIRRSQQFEIQRRIVNREHRDLIRKLINDREVNYCANAFKDHNANEIIESLKFARGFDISQTGIRVENDMALFQTVQVLRNILSKDIEIVNPSPENEVESQHLSYALYVYNKVYKYLAGSEPYTMLLHKVFLQFIDLPYSQTKAYYERYKNLFSNFLFIDGAGLIADHLAQVIEKHSDTREGINIKLKHLLSILVDKSGYKQPDFPNECEEVLIKFVSILTDRLATDTYMNVALLLWKLTRLMKSTDSTGLEHGFNSESLNTVDIFKYFKNKAIVNDADKLQLVSLLTKSIVQQDQYNSLSERAAIGVIKLKKTYNINPKEVLENFKGAQFEHYGSGRLLVLLSLLIQYRLEDKTQIKNIIDVLAARKPVGDRQSDLLNVIVNAKDDEIPDGLISMIRTTNSIKQWIDFFASWAQQEDVYRLGLKLPESLSQLKKVVKLQTVIKMGCAKVQEEAYLLNLFPLLGTEIIEKDILQVIAEIDRQDPKDLKPLKKVSYLYLIMQLSVRHHPQIEQFLVKNLHNIDLFETVSISDNSLNDKVNKSVRQFFLLLTKLFKSKLQSLNKNLLKMDASARAHSKEQINQTFQLLRHLPSAVLNGCLEVVKEDDQNWESQEEEPEEDSEKSDEQPKAMHNEVKEKKQAQEDHESEDSYHSDEDAADYESDGLIPILLDMGPGYDKYLRYLDVRQLLDVHIRGQYEQLKSKFSKKQLDDETLKYLREVKNLLEDLGKASTLIYQKMNQTLLDVLIDMGLKMPEDFERKTEQKVANKIPQFQNVDDSQLAISDDDDDDEDMDEGSVTEEEPEEQNQDLTNPEIEQPNEQHAENDDEEEQGDDQEQVQPQPEQSDETTEAHDAPQEIMIEAPAMTIQQIFGQLFGNGVIPRRHKRRREVDMEMCEQPQTNSLLDRFNTLEPNMKNLTPEEFEKAIQLVIFKYFDEQVPEIFTCIHKNLLNSKYCGSIYANSIFSLMRIHESEANSQILKEYPMLTKDYEDTLSSLTMYERFIINTLTTFSNINAPEHYSQMDPPIQSTQEISQLLKLQPQPNIITLCILLIITINNDNIDIEFDKLVECFKMLSDSGEQNKDNGNLKVRNQHLEKFCRLAYRKEISIHDEELFGLLMDSQSKKSLKILLRVGLEELSLDTEDMNKRIKAVQQDVIKFTEDRANLTNILNDITRANLKKYNTLYYNLKHRIKDYLTNEGEDQESLYKSINENETLIRIVKISLHHMNFYKQYLEVPDKPTSKSLNQLLMNEFCLANFAFMVFNIFNKTVKLSQAGVVDFYLKENLLTPEIVKFKSLQQAINLIQPLLGYEFMCQPKYQKVLLTPIFDDPKSGYHLPVNFRLIEMAQEDGYSQMLEIRRGCSFDIAFYQLSKPHFRIEYHKEEGNDQGGLRRQFMLGWQGIGIGEQANFLGKILAIAFRDNMLYGGRFDVSMALALTGYKLGLQFVKNDDPEFYKSLLWMRNNPIEELSLDFTTHRHYYGTSIPVELKHNGSKIDVTDENKDQYIQLLLKEKYFGGREHEMKELRKGFFSIVPEKVINILTPNELLDRISGVDTFNVEQLKKNVTYQGYSPTSEIIQWFWNEVTSFDLKQRQTFLHFLTGTYKLPHGLKNYSFTIERVYDTNRLPVAHTCFNTLDLPQYTTYSVFRDKFRTAVFEGNDTYGIM